MSQKLGSLKREFLDAEKCRCVMHGVTANSKTACRAWLKKKTRAKR